VGDIVNHDAGLQRLHLVHNRGPECRAQGIGLPTHKIPVLPAEGPVAAIKGLKDANVLPRRAGQPKVKRECFRPSNEGGKDLCCLERTLLTILNQISRDSRSADESEVRRWRGKVPCH